MIEAAATMGGQETRWNCDEGAPCRTFVGLSGPVMSTSRLLLVLVALVGAIATAMVFLPIAALVDPATRRASADLTVATLFAVLAGAVSDHAPGQALATMLSVVRSVATAICALPILLVGLLGETAKVASWIWYGVATGAVVADFPFVLRARAHAHAPAAPTAVAVEIRFAIAFFLTGVVSGLTLLARDAPFGSPLGDRCRKRAHQNAFQATLLRHGSKDKGRKSCNSMPPWLPL
jgi:hypothetical protein